MAKKSSELDDLTSDYASSAVNEAAVRSHTDGKKKRRLNLRAKVQQAPLQDIALSDISVGDQPRKFFDDDKLAELAQSIQDRGQLEPIKVLKKGDDYELIFGERRFRASSLIPGKKTIKALVFDEGMDSRSIILDQLAENIHREDLNPIEKSQGLMALVALPELAGIGNAELAKQVQKSETYVSRLLTLAKLDAEYQDLLLINSSIFGSKFIYDRLPALINAAGDNPDELHQKIYDSIEAGSNLFIQESQAEPKRRGTIAKKRPGRKKAEALELATFKCNPAISIRVSSVKKEKDPAKRKEMVEKDLRTAVEALKEGVAQRFKPYLDEAALQDIINKC